VIEVTNTLSIPEEELQFKASRSSGPGGQNVNKLNTRMTLLFDVRNSPSLSQGQKESIRKLLVTRINQEGVLRVVCQQHRTQAANKRGATERFVEVLVDALKKRRPRRKTQVSAAVKRRRREERERRSRLKRRRSGSVEWDE
jgi:ribosome-associated protein